MPEIYRVKLNEAVGKVNCMRVFNSNQCEKKCAIKQAMVTQKSVIGKRVKVLDNPDKSTRSSSRQAPLLIKRVNIGRF